MPKLFVSITTTHGVFPMRFMAGVLSLFQMKDVEVVLTQSQNCYVNLARNTAAADFLDSDCTHLMFIDADIVFDASHVERLLSHDVDIVGGMIPKKRQDRLELVCNALPDRPHEDERGLIPLRHVSTGFMLINKRVFKYIRNISGNRIQYNEYVTDRVLWDFFPMGIIEDGALKRYSVEDWSFCDEARRHGFVVWGDMKVQLGHIGSVIFPLESQIKEHQAKHGNPAR